MWRSCRCRQELYNECLLAQIGVDVAENEPPKFQCHSHGGRFCFIFDIPQILHKRIAPCPAMPSRLKRAMSARGAQRAAQMAFRGSSYYLDPSAQSEVWRQVQSSQEGHDAVAHKRISISSILSSFRRSMVGYENIQCSFQYNVLKKFQEDSRIATAGSPCLQCKQSHSFQSRNSACFWLWESLNYTLSDHNHYMCSAQITVPWSMCIRAEKSLRMRFLRRLERIVHLQVIKREEKQQIRQHFRDTDSQHSTQKAPSSCGSFRPPPSVLS